MKLKEKRYTVHLDITKSLIDYDAAKLKKVRNEGHNNIIILTIPTQWRTYVLVYYSYFFLSYYY